MLKSVVWTCQSRGRVWFKCSVGYHRCFLCLFNFSGESVPWIGWLRCLTEMWGMEMFSYWVEDWIDLEESKDGQAMSLHWSADSTASIKSVCIVLVTLLNIKVLPAMHITVLLKVQTPVHIRTASISYFKSTNYISYFDKRMLNV